MAWGGGNANTVDAWVKRLRDNDPSFTSLHILSFRRITTTELGQVFEALAGNAILKELYASGHALDESAARLLATALQKNSTLERLNIGNDTMGSHTDVMEILAEGLAQNHSLVRLDLENKGLGGHEGSVRALAKALEGSETTTTLQELNLARNKLTDQDVVILSKALSSNRMLQKLDLCLNSFSQEGTQAVAEYLASPGQALKEIDLSDNEISEEGGVAMGSSLAQNTTLERLRMSSVMDPPLPVEEGLEEFIAFDAELAELNTALTAEQVLELRSDGDTVLETIAQSLRTNTTLQELWMDYCNISPVGAEALASALRENTGLITVRMRNNSVGNRGARALGSALTPAGGAFNSTLHSLELGENKIGVLGWHGLVSASALESLGLYANKIHTLHEALESHQSHVVSTASPVSPVPSSTDNIPALDATVANGASSATHVLEKLVHLDVGCNSISREHFTQLGVSLIKGLVPALIKLEIAGNGDRSESGGGGGHSEEPEEDHEEQSAWERVATRIEEARPNLVIHWKGAQARE
ncbi:hypothetical protein BGZ93_002030 [Podila epicladia]|nr:hypothetical protein BGZ93_002030 [Podila epicladia]KAG0084701.1 hypothetical protein BGZ92_009647 [Podila epicladia]